LLKTVPRSMRMALIGRESASRKSPSEQDEPVKRATVPRPSEASFAPRPSPQPHAAQQGLVHRAKNILKGLHRLRPIDPLSVIPIFW
jgi:hypothetical protein